MINLNYRIKLLVMILYQELRYKVNDFKACEVGTHYRGNSISMLELF